MLLGYDKAFGRAEGEDEINPVDNIVDSNSPLIEDIVADRDLLCRLMQKLDDLVPNGGRIIQMLMDEYSDREMVKALNLKSQSTLNYRKNKVKAYMRDHWSDYFG